MLDLLGTLLFQYHMLAFALNVIDGTVHTALQVLDTMAVIHVADTVAAQADPDWYRWI
ncbi:MAG: hypothetical protein J2P17_27505 [Mycobacterium sp.]|nr:hypothetical protein [Mycobacterium sp.]